MKKTYLVSAALTVALGLFLASLASGTPTFSRATKMSCATCHTNVAGGADFTDAGKAFKADSTKVPSASVAGADYTGSNKCRMCHLKQHKAWAETPHAKAFAALTTSDPKLVAEMAARLKVELKGPADKNDACLGCHVTGFQLAGGYPGADSTKTAQLVNVTCENCHGPGSKHATAPTAEKKNFINKAVGEKLCRSCHTPEMSPKFNFEEYKKKGVHVVAAATK